MAKPVRARKITSPPPWPSDRALSEIQTLSGGASLIGTGVPMIWPSAQTVGLIFFVGGVLISAGTFATVVYRHARKAKTTGHVPWFYRYAGPVFLAASVSIAIAYAKPGSEIISYRDITGRDLVAGPAARPSIPTLVPTEPLPTTRRRCNIEIDGVKKHDNGAGPNIEGMDDVCIRGGQIYKKKADSIRIR